MVAKTAVGEPGGGDWVYPYFNLDYFFYIAPAIAGFLILCVLASYCFRLCQYPRRRGYESSNLFGPNAPTQRGNTVTNNANNRRQDPFMTDPFFPWSNQRRQRRYERMRGQDNSRIRGLGHQYYPPASNPAYNGQGISNNSLPPTAPNFSDIQPNTFDAPPSYTTAMRYQQTHHIAPSNPMVNPATVPIETGGTQEQLRSLPPAYDSHIRTNTGQNTRQTAPQNT